MGLLGHLCSFATVSLGGVGAPAPLEMTHFLYILGVDLGSRPSSTSLLGKLSPDWARFCL